VIAAVAATAFGWAQGFLRPLAAEIAFLVAALLVAAFQAPVLALLQPRLNLPPALILLLVIIGVAFLLNIPAGRIAARLRATRLGPADSVLGVIVQLAIAFVVIYLAVVSLVHAERAVRPLLGPSITPAAVDTFAAEVQQDAVLHALVRPEQLTADRRAAATGRLTLTMIEVQHPWIRLYLTSLRPALLHSRLAPVVLRYGNGLPLVGRPGTAIP